MVEHWPAAARRISARAIQADPRHRVAGRPGLLQHRHPPHRHRGRSRSGRRVLAQPARDHRPGARRHTTDTHLVVSALRGDAAAAERLTSAPFRSISTGHAVRLGLLDAVYETDDERFTASLRADALRLADPNRFDELLAAKRARLHRDQRAKPLAHYRAHEMARSSQCIFGPDQRYHRARRQFAYNQQHRPGLPAKVSLA